MRLTAIRSFFRFASFEEPAHSALIQRVLAIPSKRDDKRQMHFLTRPEIEAILAAPDRTTWLGRRDYALLLLAAQTGLRLSKLISLDREAVHLGAVGKGRKERCTPLTSQARSVLQPWLKEPVRHGASALFPDVHGGRLSSDSVQSLLAKYVRVASKRCPSLGSKRVPSSMTSIHWPGSPTYSPASPTSRRVSFMNYCRGTAISTRRSWRRPREQLVKQLLRPPQAFITQNKDFALFAGFAIKPF